MVSTFLPILLPLLGGVVVALISYASKRITSNRKLAEIKADYPLIDVALKTISQMTNGTPYDYLFDVAAQVYGGTEIDNIQAAALAKQAVDAFSETKYLETNWDALPEAQVIRGREIAETILATVSK